MDQGESFSELLKFGAVIYLEEENIKGKAIFSEGFSNSEQRLREISHKDTKNYFTRCLFKVLPSFVNKRKNELNDLDPKNPKNKDVEQTTQSTKTLEVNIERELAVNFDTLEKLWGRNIEYYSTFQQLHINSNKYLTFDEVSAEQERENYKIYLSDFPFDRTNFMFEPSYKFQQRQTYVTFDIPVLIRANKIIRNKKPYLHTTTTDLSAIRPTVVNNNAQKNKFIDDDGLNKNNETLLEDDFYDINDDLFLRAKNNIITNICKDDMVLPDDSVDFKAYESEINTSLETQTKWRLKPFSKGDENDQLINYGDIVWITHIELDAYLSAFKFDKGKTEYKILGNIQSEYGLEYVQKDNVVSENKRYGNTNGMWILESEQRSTGGIIEKGMPVRLKHMALGLYLTLVESVPDSPGQERSSLTAGMKSDYALGLSDTPLKNNCFLMNPVYGVIGVKDTGKYISKDGFFEIKNQEGTLWLKAITQFDNEINTETFIPIVEPNFQDSNVFRIAVATKKDTVESQFLLSNVPKLKNHLTMLQNNSKKSFHLREQEYKKQYDGTLKAQKDLTLFCQNREVFLSADDKFNVPNPARQNSLHEQGVLEMMSDILKLEIPEEEFSEQIASYDFIYKHNYMKMANPDTSVVAVESKTSFSHEKSKEIIMGKLMQLKNKAIDQSEFSRVRKTLSLLMKKISVMEAVFLLLSTVCKHNSVIQEAYYRQIYDWLYLCKYIKLAVDCCISQVGENFSIINTFSNEAKFIEANQEETNFITFYINVAVKKAQYTDPNPLRFMRAICTFSNSGVFPCQEALHKLLNIENMMLKEFFMKILVQEEQCFIYPQVEGHEDRYEISKFFAEKTSPLYLKNYIVQEIFFVSDLSMTRNKLWKSKFDNMYPAKEILSFCFNKDIPNEIRAGFVQMIVNLHIDQEPQTAKEYPQMCRFLDDCNRINRVNEDNTTNFKFPELIPTSIQESIVYLTEISERIVAQFKAHFVNDSKKKNLDNEEPVVDKPVKELDEKEKIEVEKIEEAPVDKSDILDDLLPRDMIKLIQTLTNFDILNLKDTKDELLEIFEKMFYILIYDHRQIAYSSLIYTWCVPDSVKLGTIEGNQEDGVDDAPMDDAANAGRKKAGFFTDPAYVNNPLVRTYWAIKYKLRCLTVTDSEPEIETEDEIPPDIQKIMIKCDVCAILKSYQDRRTDFLITNFICWFKKKQKEMLDKIHKDPTKKDQILIDLIEKEIVNYLMPDVREIGDDQIDSKIAKKTDGRGFTVYCDPLEAEEVPDISMLLGGTKFKPVKLIPSLIVILFMEDESELVDNLLDIILKSYMQREQYIHSIVGLELISTQADVDTFFMIKKINNDLRTGVDDQYFSLITIDQLSCVEILDNIIVCQEFWHDQLQGVDNESSEQSKQRIMAITHCQQPFIKLYTYLMRYKCFKLGIGNADMEAAPEKIESIIQFCTEFLKFFCKNMPSNQMKVFEHYESLTENITDEKHFIELVKAIYTGNRVLCENYPEKMIDLFNSLLYTYGRRARFLEILICLISVEDEFISENQVKMLKLLSPERNVNNPEYCYKFFLKRSDNYFKFDFNPEKFEHELADNNVRHDEPYYYHSNLLIVLRDALNDISCSFHVTDMFNLAYLFELLGRDDSFLKKDYEIYHTPDLKYNPELLKNEKFSLFKMELIQFVINLIASKKSVAISVLQVSDVERLILWNKKQFEKWLSTQEGQDDLKLKYPSIQKEFPWPIEMHNSFQIYITSFLELLTKYFNIALQFTLEMKEQRVDIDVAADYAEMIKKNLSFFYGILNDDQLKKFKDFFVIDQKLRKLLFRDEPGTNALKLSSAMEEEQNKCLIVIVEEIIEVNEENRKCFIFNKNSDPEERSQY